MPLLNWDNNYSVKIKEIDEQHKSWIDLINYMHEAMKAGKGKEVIGDVLDEVMNYSAFHFKSEEKLFDKYNYPDSNHHKKLHADFVAAFNKMKQRYAGGGSVTSVEIMQHLKDWLINHILKADKQYSEFLNSKGVN